MTKVKRPCMYAVAAFVTWIGGYALATALLQGNEEGLRLLGSVAYELPFFVALVLCGLMALRSTGRRRAFWGALALALALNDAADLYWSAWELTNSAGMAFPSSADAFYLCSYLPVLAAVAFGFGGRTVRSLRALLDGSVLAAAIGYVGAVALILPQLGAYQWFPTAISVAYPLADIVILTVLLTMVFGGHQSVPRSYLIVAAAYAASALTDTGYTYLEGVNGYSTGSWLDIGWQVQAVLLCIAAATALRGEEEPEARILSRDTGLVPVLIGVGVMLVVVGAQSLGQTLGVGAVVLMGYAVVAVVLRLLLVSRENWEIARELELSLAEQERLAVTDGLTGLRNRRFLEAALTHEFGRARRSERGAGLLVIDIDHFKRINDEHGHLAGDAVLQEVAQRLAAMMRSGDVVARYGGEEFVALLPETESESLLELGERCRKAIASHEFDFGDDQLSVTVSIGGAVFPLDANTAEELLTAADRALYRAKRLGRNRFELCSGMQDESVAPPTWQAERPAHPSLQAA